MGNTVTSTPPAPPPPTTSNGCPKFQLKSLSSLPSKPKFRRSLKYVATIDFGTTHCSVAYVLFLNLLKNVPGVHLQPTLLALEGNTKRIPNCVLFNNEGELEYLGVRARERWANMDHQQRPGYYYFDHVKKLLQYDESLTRDTTVKASNGTPYFLVSVIAHILHKLKKQLIQSVRVQGYDIQATDFDWVITVPAFWKDKGKQMMREAGYMAGLCSCRELPRLSKAEGKLPQQPEEKSPENLSLALESEAAAIHCQHESKFAQQDPQYGVRPEHYIVVDAGGGTVDIASHSIMGEYVHEIVPSAGEYVGGTTVNEQFSLFMQAFVDDPQFSSYHGCNNPIDQSRHEADENELLFTRFESQKVLFGECADHCASDTYLVAFPHSFWKHYHEKLVAKGRIFNQQGDMSVSVEDDGRALRISSSKMTEFFAPVIKNVSELLERHLTNDGDRVGKTIDTIYWAGGFGKSEYLRKNVERHLEKLKFYHRYQFPVIADAENAVVLGATTFRCFPSIVRKRKADATYGVECWMDFIEGKHLPAYRSTSNEKKCEKIFCAIVEKGDDINTGELFVSTFTPVSSRQTAMTFNIFSATHRDVEYVDERGVHAERRHVTVDMGGTGLGRPVEVMVDITHAELQVRARDDTSGNEKKVVVDFFCTAADTTTHLGI